ncbi:tail sheath [Listeria phage LIS04]|nr:tail sheath [Listeria phage LIS04]
MVTFLAPAVKTTEQDLSAYIGQSSTCIVGMIGGASKGPIGVPTLITNGAQFISTFGEPTVQDHGPISALQTLKSANQLWYIREADETLVASATLDVDGLKMNEPEDEADEPTFTEVEKVLNIKFVELGTFGNRYSVSVSKVNGLAFTLSIYNGKLVYKSYQASLDSTSPNFIENYSDDEFEFTVEIGEATQLKEINKVSLAGGHDGLPVPIAKIIGTGNRGLQAFANPNLIDINVLTAPGRWEGAVVREVLAISQNRTDCISIIDPPQGLTPTQVVEYHNGTLLGDNMPEGGLDSSYGAMYYPWVKVANSYTGVDQFVPPSGVIAGAYAFNDSVAEVWYSPSGLNRGMLTSVLALEYDMSEGEQDHLYGNGNVINPLINYKKNGFVIWGNRTLQRENSALDRVNVRRMMTVVRKAITASTAYSLFEQNDPFTWAQWVGTVEPYLETIKNGRGLYDYKVVMDNTTVTETHIDRNEMPGQVFLKPTKTAEFIQIDFVLKPTGASFGD